MLSGVSIVAFGFGFTITVKGPSFLIHPLPLVTFTQYTPEVVMVSMLPVLPSLQAYWKPKLKMTTGEQIRMHPNRYRTLQLWTTLRIALIV